MERSEEELHIAYSTQPLTLREKCKRKMQCFSDDDDDDDDEDGIVVSKWLMVCESGSRK